MDNFHDKPSTYSVCNAWIHRLNVIGGVSKHLDIMHESYLSHCVYQGYDNFMIVKVTNGLLDALLNSHCLFDLLLNDLLLFSTY